MKIRTMTGILIVALVALSVGVVAAQYGQGGGGGGAQYMDSNGDGECDNVGNCTGFVDSDGDGECDNVGNCTGFVDSDGDGECDNIGTNGRDSDGDGTPNGQDEDYVSPKDGSGNRCGYGNGCNR